MDFGAAEIDSETGQGSCGGVPGLEWKNMAGGQAWRNDFQRDVGKCPAEIALNTEKKRWTPVNGMTSVFFFKFSFKQEPIGGFLPG